MSAHLLLTGLSFIVCLIIAAVLFSNLIKISFLRNRLLASSLSFGCASVLGVVPIVFFNWYSYDFVSAITPWQYLGSFLCIFIIILGLFIRLPFASLLTTLLASFAAVFICDFSSFLLPQSYPIWLNNGLIALALFGFTYGWKALSGLNPLPQIEGITISIGILLLSLFGFAPFSLGASAAGILGVSLIAYFYSQNQPLGSDSSPAIGFIFGWLGLISYGEYLIPCFLIFSMLYLLELMIAFARKITLLPKYHNICYNTISVQSFTNGCPASLVLHTLWSANILLIILGVLQIHGTNSFSIPFVAGLISAWQLYRLINWQQDSKTLKETNQQLIKDIKTSFNKIFSKPKKGKRGKH